MEVSVNNSPLSETQLPYHSDRDENKCRGNSFVRNIPIDNFPCENTICDIIAFAHSLYKDFLSIVSSSSEESKNCPTMYGAFKNGENTYYNNGSVKYYSPTDLSKICRQNIDAPSMRESENCIKIPKGSGNAEQEKSKKNREHKSRKKSHKDKRKHKSGNKSASGEACIINNQEYGERKEEESKRGKKNGFSGLNYYDLQCLINDCIPPNTNKERYSEGKKQQRSQSIDQIPTKDGQSEQIILRRSERPKSAERREKDNHYMKYYLHDMPSNSHQIHEQQEPEFITQNQQFSNQHSSKRHKEKSRNRKKTPRDVEVPEFVTLDQIKEQTMNISDEKFTHHKHHTCDKEKKVRHHEPREFYDEQQYLHNLASYNYEQDLNSFITSPDEYNKFMKEYYQCDKADVSRTKERNREKNREHRKKTSDKEYKALKKYMKKLAKAQQKELFNLTKQDIVEPIQDKRVQRDRRFLEENLLKFDQELDVHYAMENMNSISACNQVVKEFIPLDSGLDELQKSEKPHRKKHDHKKKKNKKEIVNGESSERLRSNSLLVKKNHTNFNDTLKNNGDLVYGELQTKCKSETSLIHDKDIICIYRNKDDKADAKTIKLTEKHECLSIDKAKKHRKKAVKEHKEEIETECSPYNHNPIVLQTECDQQMSDVLKMHERSLLFQKAMRKDTPRPRPRLSRSRQRSTKYLTKLENSQHNCNNLEVDEKPTKEVHCYDVGTSTILDNNFGDVLELLKGEPLTKPPGSNKRRSVFHVKKKASREDLVESTRKASDDGGRTLGIVVKGIEPPRKLETDKVRSRFKFPSEKCKVNKLQCKMLSVVAIPPGKIDNGVEMDQNPMKTQSTPQMLHDTIARNSDKRLERLLKYYKVEAQSKIINQTKTSTKSIKSLIADKISDYLKKLKEDDNDEILQIQTDDPKVVKLILPIDLHALEDSHSSGFEMKVSGFIADNPKESFSDLYINYTADNIDEEDNDLNSLEIMKLESNDLGRNDFSSNNLISNPSLSPKNNKQKSIIFLNRNSLNFSQMESRSEFPVCPRLNKNSSEFGVIQEFSSELKQRVEASSSNKPFVKQNQHLGIEDQFYGNTENLPTYNTEGEYWNHTPKIGQTPLKNLNYKNNISTAKQNNNTTKENEMTTAKTMKESHSFSTRRKNEEVFVGNSQSYNNSPNYKQVVEKSISKRFDNISEIKTDVRKTTKAHHGILAREYEEVLNNQDSGRFQSNSVEYFDDTDEPPKQAPAKLPYKQKYNNFEHRENVNISTKINAKMTSSQDEKNNEKGQIFDYKIAVNSNSQEKKVKERPVNLQPHTKPYENSPRVRGYEYFEIPVPKPMKKIKLEQENNGRIKPDTQAIDSPPIEPRFSRNSQIPKKISTTIKNTQNLQDFSSRPQQIEKEEEHFQDDCKKFYGTLGTDDSNYQKENNVMDNSLQKCFHWNTKNSETIVMSEFNVSVQKKTDTETTVPIKSNIPVARRDQSKLIGKSCLGNENNTTMFLTKSYKVAPGQSSYEKRKMYDTRIRKNIKRRSLSENSDPTKISPHVYEVRYCNVYNQCLPNLFNLGGSRSDQNLSNFSTDFDMAEFQKSIESLTTAPSCFLKESKYGKDRVDMSTEPSCLWRESKYRKDEVNLSTEPSCLLKENVCSLNVEAEQVCLSTEPSCLLKGSKYDITENKRERIEKQASKGNHQTAGEISKIQSSKSRRINELIKDNLLYSNYSTQNEKPRSAIPTRKKKKKVEKEKIFTKTKLIFRCSKKSSRENGKKLNIVTKCKENRNDENIENSIDKDDFEQCQNLTKLSIEKVVGNELCISSEERKLPSVEDKVGFVEKSEVSFPTCSEFSNDRVSSVSSKSTLVNCEAPSSLASEESKETVKEREVFLTSADDSGYLTKEAERIPSETTFQSTNDQKSCCSDVKYGIPGYQQKTSVKISNWNQKDLAKLRVQLLFPHVYDDFELLEKARNTNLIKFYVESKNDKLKEAIESISQKDNMSTKSRSVMSLPSVKMIPEETNFDGDVASKFSYKGPKGGFFSYQKFIAQNNECYSTNIMKNFTKPTACGDCTDIFERRDISETCSVRSCNISSAKSSVSVKKSVIELFKLRPSSAKKSSSCTLSDNETLVGENGEECLSMNNNISDEDFFKNFHQIMAIECQSYAKKVRDTSKSKKNIEDDLEYEEISLDCLLKNKNLAVESSDDYLEQDFQFASDEMYTETNASTESVTKESNESFKSVTCIKPKRSISKWQKLLKKKSSPGPNSNFSLHFYPQEKMSILDMIKSVQASSLSEDSLMCSSKNKEFSLISSGEVTKKSEKQFFDNLLAFYDKESDLIKKIIRDDEFFSSLLENIRSSEDTSQLISLKDVQKKAKKEKKKGLLSRFFRWKEKKSTETLFENPSMGKSLEFAKSMSNESSSITRESCYSFYKDLDDLEKDVNEAKHPDSEHLQQLAHRAKCHLEPMVQATISNRHINDKIKLAGFLKMLDMVSKGDFTFLNNGDKKTLEEKLREHVAQMFEKVYRIANREVMQKNTILDHEKIQLLKMLVTKYHMGIETHINILAIYIGRGLIVSRLQLEDAIIYLMGQDSQEINFEQLEKNCNIQSGYVPNKTTE